MHDELTSVGAKLVLRRSTIVIPESLQQRTVQLAHEGHQGQAKTKMLLRDKVWFPRLDQLADYTVKNCLLCQVTTPKSKCQPRQMTKLPAGPWQEVGADFCEVAGLYKLVAMDDYSRYPELQVLTPTSAKAVIRKLYKIFSSFGMPHIIKTDNGPPFNSKEFAKFSGYLGFQHSTVTPLWPESNG